MSVAAIRKGLRAAVVLAAIGRSAIAAGPSGASETLRDGFESPRPSWLQEESDATVKLQVHDRSERAFHEGRLAEHFVFEAGPGSYHYYSYALPKTPLVDGLRASLYVRASQPGIRLYGRVILPADTDPNGGAPTAVMVEGSGSDAVNRWQRLELADLRLGAERQARIIRLQTGRPVSLEGAYLERLVVNLYGGAGQTEVFLDDLTVAPVPNVALPTARPPAVRGPEVDRPPTGAASIKFAGNRLSRNGDDWVPRIIHAPGADLAELWRSGFDVLALDPRDDLERARAASELGFLLMPPVHSASDPAQAVAELAQYPLKGQVAFWNLGDGLGGGPEPEAREAELARVRELIMSLRDLPPGTPKLTTATVAGLVRQYALAGQNLDLIGARADSWGTEQEPFDNYRFLVQRRDLTALRNPHQLFWAWIAAMPYPGLREAVWGGDVPPKWGEPRVQAEQIRLYVYNALAAGYRGLGILGDADLTRGPGKARLYELALLNAEISLMQAIIGQGADPIEFWPAFPPDPPVVLTYNSSGNLGGFGSMGRSQQNNKPPEEVKPHNDITVAAIATADNRGKLLLVNDIAGGSQFQPPQMAQYDLNLLVPVPDAAQAYEISPGVARVLKSKRDAGGRRVTIPSFGTTAMVLLTTDAALFNRLRDEVKRIRPRAVDLAIRQAELETQEVAEVNEQLTRTGHGTRNADDLLKAARDMLKTAREAQAREDYERAWDEARQVGRPLRMLMRYHWDEAKHQVDLATTRNARVETPIMPPGPSYRRSIKRPPELLPTVACPPLVAMNTVPQAHIWRSWIAGGVGRFGENLVPSGSFEDPDSLVDAGWTVEETQPEGVLARVKPVKDGWGSSQAALKLTVYPSDPATFDRQIQFLDEPAIAIRTPPIRVARKNFLRIRVYLKMLRELPRGGGGLIVRDSIGGAPLQFRTTNGTKGWRALTLYRLAPADGDFSVSIGLAGFGEVVVDDLRIDRLEPPEPGTRRRTNPPVPPVHPLAGRPANRRLSRR